jgi:hypothetical protein
MGVSVFAMFVDTKVGSTALQMHFESVFGDILVFYLFLLN